MVAITHYHEDHGWFGALPGAPTIADRGGHFEGVDFRMTTYAHDGCGGTQMGLSRLIWFTLDGLSILHPGDIGAAPRELPGPVDLLLLPVGGRYTLPPQEAISWAQRLSQRWVVPMHYRCEAVDLPMATLEEALSLLPEGTPLTRQTSPEVTLDRHTPEGWLVLPPASALA